MLFINNINIFNNVFNNKALFYLPREREIKSSFLVEMITEFSLICYHEIVSCYLTFRKNKVFTLTVEKNS